MWTGCGPYKLFVAQIHIVGATENHLDRMCCRLVIFRSDSHGGSHRKPSGQDVVQRGDFQIGFKKWGGTENHLDRMWSGVVFFRLDSHNGGPSKTIWTGCGPDKLFLDQIHIVETTGTGCGSEWSFLHWIHLVGRATENQLDRLWPRMFIFRLDSHNGGAIENHLDRMCSRNSIFLFRFT